MKYFKHTVFPILLMILASTAFALTVKHDAAKNHITQGYYIGTIQTNGASKKFRIIVPQAKDAYEFRHLQTKEMSQLDGSYVSFGPAAIDGTIYRMLIAKRVDPNLPLEIANKYSTLGLTQILGKGYEGQMNIINRKKISYRGYPGIYTVLTQQRYDRLLTHSLYYIFYQDKILTFLITNSSSSGKHAINAKNLDVLVERKLESNEKFVNSFQFPLK